MKLKNLIKEEVTLSGPVKLYHYMQNDMGNEIILDPEIAIKNKSFWTTNDYKISDVPRVFYYTDLNKTEKMVKTKNLYVGQVDGSKILNLTDSVKEYVNNSTSLEAKNKDFEYYEYQYGGHNIVGISFTQAMQRSVEFFKKNL